VKCGARHGLTHETFSVTYTPPWAYLGILGGVIPLMLLLFLLRKRHSAEVLFCEDCADRYRLSRYVSPLTAAALAAILIGSVALSVSGGSGMPLLVGLLLMAATVVGAMWFQSSARPKCARLDGNNAILEVPGVGHVPLADHVPGQFFAAPPYATPYMWMDPGAVPRHAPAPPPEPPAQATAGWVGSITRACPRCDLANFADAAACRRCGATL
jgi:hypothetical protein